MAGWIGVDLDGTLAHFDRWRGPMHIGLPIPAMAKRVLDWHARGVEVRIFTARASRPELIPDVQKWLQRHGFPPLAVTNEKDFGMVELWDDRAIQVLYNTGKAVRPNHLEETEKAELFDPDVVYADDEGNKEIKPTAQEIANFKHNIKATTDNSLHSLDDLLEALDDGDYAPGAGNAPDATPATYDATAASTIEPLAELSAGSALDLPIHATGFVSDKDKIEAPLGPKNSLVEVDIDQMDMGPDFSDGIDTNDKVPEFKVEQQAPQLQSTATDADEFSNAASEKPWRDTLDNQPLGKSKSVGRDESNDVDLDLTNAMDDAPEDISNSELKENRNKRAQKSPTLTAFPEDELDDLDDLPTFNVERR